MTDGSMKCGACQAPGSFSLIEREIPQSAPDGWVLIDIAAVGLCGTDYHIFEGKHPFLTYPRVIGHELSARVARSAEGWEEGALVVVNPYIACGICRPCQRGRPNCCTKLEVLGVHRDGGLCRRIAVPAGNLYSADGLSPLEAAMVEFLAIGAHAVARSGVGPGDRAIVSGIGPIGLGTALFARLAGAKVHVRDTGQARLKTARDRFGFTDIHHVTPDEPVGMLDGAFDAVFDATGNIAAMEAGFPLVAHGGTYTLVGVVKGFIAFDDAEFHRREIRLLASRNAVKADFETVMAALLAKTIDSEALCSQILRFDDVEHRLPELAADRADLIKAIVDMAA